MRCEIKLFIFYLFIFIFLWVVELGHSGHMGINATKRLLRMRLWFPGMDKMVEEKVATCLPCQAATDSHQRDPLKPNPAPSEPWDRLYCDHWGPIPYDGKHILVLIDALTRYPEVLVVKGTGADDNIHSFSEVFARHGYPRYLHSDNGPPFNGTDSHLLQEYFRSIGVQHLPNHSAQDPESTGLVESFMRHIKKVFHTAVVEQQDPYLILQDHLWQFRATPHPSTNKSPAELLFGRKFRTILPDLRTNPARARRDILEARAADQVAKERMAAYKDNKTTVHTTSIKPGDLVLLKQKSSKLRPIYDPEPYKVTQTWGTQIEAKRDGIAKKRDAQCWKKVNPPYQHCPQDDNIHTILLPGGPWCWSAPTKGTCSDPCQPAKGSASPTGQSHGTLPGPAGCSTRDTECLAPASSAKTRHNGCA